MRKFIIFTLFAFLSYTLSAGGRLVLINTESSDDLKGLFNQSSLTVHYYNDDYVIGTLEGNDLADKSMTVLDEDAFGDTDLYFIAYCYPEKKNSYVAETGSRGALLYDGGNFLILKQFMDMPRIEPAKNDGMVCIENRRAYLPVGNFEFPDITEIDPYVQMLTNNIHQDSIAATVQHLEDYGTRRYNLPQADEAAEWIKEAFERYGLEAAIQDFSTYSWYEGYISSSNVIAVQMGTTNPEEFIVCGGHYDSVNWYDGAAAPGADDNASGTAGIMEIARIFSQFEFERSIIYCAFGAEEIGLCGSAAYAAQCKSQGMNILGYFNIDMSGYLKPGLETLISIIHPSAAAPLANFYIDVLNTYFEGTQYEQLSGMSGGDSDHTSFNNQGYMGIYPFENESNYSPYIHRSTDKVGVSFNTPEQALLYTQITASCIAELAVPVSEITTPVPDFISSETEIIAGGRIDFEDQSDNAPMHWKWYFEGGTPETSEEQNPSITYNEAGLFDVKLVVENLFGKDSILKENFIKVDEAPLPVADFSADKRDILQGESVMFTDLSGNEPTSWNWYFEGGTPEVSTEQHPSVVYYEMGQYAVKLTVSNNFGSDEKEEDEMITVAGVGIGEISKPSRILISPNPVTGGSLLKIEGEVLINTIELINLSGAVLNRFEMKAAAGAISIPAPSAGLYFLRLHTAEGIQTVKIQVQ